MKNRILFEGSYLDPEKKQTSSERSDSQVAPEELWFNISLGKGGPKKSHLHCKPVRCLKLVNHGFPSKSEQEIRSEAVKSVQALLCFMYVCM